MVGTANSIYRKTSRKKYKREGISESILCNYLAIIKLEHNYDEKKKTYYG